MSAARPVGRVCSITAVGGGRKREPSALNDLLYTGYECEPFSQIVGRGHGGKRVGAPAGLRLGRGRLSDARRHGVVHEAEYPRTLSSQRGGDQEKGGDLYYDVAGYGRYIAGDQSQTSLPSSGLICAVIPPLCSFARFPTCSLFVPAARFVLASAASRSRWAAMRCAVRRSIRSRSSASFSSAARATFLALARCFFDCSCCCFCCAADGRPGIDARVGFDAAKDEAEVDSEKLTGLVGSAIDHKCQLPV